MQKRGPLHPQKMKMGTCHDYPNFVFVHLFRRWLGCGAQSPMEAAFFAKLFVYVPHEKNSR